jgi:hypothetical protein
MAKGGGNGGSNGNKAPTAINLSNTMVVENIDGTVGVLTGSDPNKRDSLIFSVDDSRFEVVVTALYASQY